jgi:hypothetical protein
MMEQELDVSNDPTVEALGGKEALRFAEEHWRRLCAHYGEPEHDSSSPCPSHQQAPLVLSGTEAEDLELLRSFNANFGGDFAALDVSELTWDTLHAPFVLETWRALLCGYEGRLVGGCAYNLLTLFRTDCRASYTLGEHEPGTILLLPRCQWYLLEVARIRSGCYARFRDQRREIEVERGACELARAMAASARGGDGVGGGGGAGVASAALEALRRLSVHRRVPRKLLARTHAGWLLGQLVRRGEAAAAGSARAVGVAAALKKTWQLALAMEQAAAAATAASRNSAAAAGQRSGCEEQEQEQEQEGRLDVWGAIDRWVDASCRLSVLLDDDGLLLLPPAPGCAPQEAGGVRAAGLRLQRGGLGLGLWLRFEARTPLVRPAPPRPLLPTMHATHHLGALPPR